MLNYIEPLFRPPSEARSLILQVTNGCSWNNCTFCEMYTAPQKKFSVKTSEEITQELQQVSASGVSVRRVFLADGDAMTLSFRRLKEILLLIRQYLPDVQRVSSYCLPRNLKNKTIDQLTELEQLGLKLMYVGCESGDDLVLEKVAKGENYQSSLDALTKIKQSGLKSSVMILNGLGGRLYSEQHAINSAKLMNEAQPEYLSTLVVSFPTGMERFQQGFGGRAGDSAGNRAGESVGDSFEPLQQLDLFKEMEILLDTLTLEKTVFRSDHASNYLVLKGTLSRDKNRLLTQVRTAIHNPDQIHLRQEWQRGL